MSNMKDILGDMTLEEFEAERKTLFEDIKKMNMDEFVEKYTNITGGLYDCWLEIEGAELANEWVSKNGGQITEDRLTELMRYLGESFVKWLGDYTL